MDVEEASRCGRAAELLLPRRPAREPVAAGAGT